MWISICTCRWDSHIRVSWANMAVPCSWICWASCWLYCTVLPPTFSGFRYRGASSFATWVSPPCAALPKSYWVCPSLHPPSLLCFSCYSNHFGCSGNLRRSQCLKNSLIWDEKKKLYEFYEKLTWDPSKAQQFHRKAEFIIAWEWEAHRDYRKCYRNQIASNSCCSRIPSDTRQGYLHFV